MAPIIPQEEVYKDQSHASQCAELLSAAVYGSWAKESVDALFEKAAELNLRLGAGKVMADRNMPEGILTSPEQDYEAAKN